MGDHEHIFYSEHCDRCGRNAEAIIDELEQQLRWRDVTKELPEERCLAFTPDQDDEMAFRIVPKGLFKTTTDATHWKPITAPETGSD